MKEKVLMVDDYMLDKVLSKIKNITDIEKFDDTKILIDTDDKLPDDITLKNVIILVLKTLWYKYVIKEDDTFYPQLFLEEILHGKWTW